ncbi:MAG: VTT domain-containing protein [Legionellaceae bacterium]|nr:VTT domain-containing protein [Legionellaceae bacterium]
MHAIISKLPTFGFISVITFILLYCMLSVLCLPIVFLALAGGAIFGPIIGVLVNVVGATLGASCGFFISRYFNIEKLAVIQGNRVQKFLSRTEKNGFIAVALLRITPAVPYNLVNYAFGLSKIKYSHFVVATCIFSIPNKAIVTYCGYYGKKILLWGCIGI